MKSIQLLPENHPDFDIKIDYLGGATVAGPKIKETGTAHWVSPYTGKTNEKGFTALPAGWRANSGDLFIFGSLGYITMWWTSTVTNEESISMSLNDNNAITFFGGYKQWGHSVRCLKDN